MAFAFLKGWFLNEELDVNPSFCAVQSPRSLNLTMVHNIRAQNYQAFFSWSL